MKIKTFAAVALALTGALLVPLGNVRADDEIAINDENFPGYYFSMKKYDTDSNGSLSPEEISLVTSLDVSFKSDNFGALYSLTSLEDLHLSCWYENGFSIDLKKFPKLKTLSLDAVRGEIKTIDLSKCSGLTKLVLDSYGGESLDISYCKDLEYFEMAYGNTLGHVDFSKNTKLKVINCSNMGQVDLSKNSALEELYLHTSASSLDLSGCPGLKKVEISSLSVKELTLGNPTGLEWLDFHANNNGQEYDLSKLTNLVHLGMKSADLKKTDFTKLTKLQYLDVHASRFKDNLLDLTKMQDLEELNVDQCYITGLDLSKNSKLSKLYCDYSNITHLDLSNNTALKTLYCSSMDLDGLVLKNNTELTDLYCVGNKTVLPELDLTSNTALKNVRITDFKNVRIGDCPDLGVVSIKSNTESVEFGNCPYLHTLSMTGNKIKTVDLSNCPLYVRATESYESTVSDTEVRTEGPLSVFYNGKTSTVSCTFSIGPDIKVVTDKISIAAFFPDENLRACVSEIADKNKDGLLSKDEISGVTAFDCSGRGIASLSGLELFTNIETIDCSDNALSLVNANLFPNLKKLICSKNELTDNSLLTDEIKLVYLDCSYNKLTSLKESNKDTLETLKASHNKLKNFYSYNYKKLKHAELSDNQLTGVHFTTVLEYLDCSNNQIEDLYGYGEEEFSLKTLDCSNNLLNDLRGVAEIESLDSLKAYGNKITYRTSLSRKMSDLYPDGVEKTYDGVTCFVLGDKYFFDPGKTYEVYRKIDAKNFPDEGLRKALSKYDDDKDGYLSSKEQRIDMLDCSGYGIKDLTGLNKLVFDTLDCSFNDLADLDVMTLSDPENTSIGKITCYGNPGLKSLTVYYGMTTEFKDYLSKSEKTAVVKVNGKDVNITYDSYTAWGYFEFNVDKGVRLVSVPVNVSVNVPEGAGVVTGDGRYDVDSDAVLEFKPADGVVFGGWFENGSLVSSDLTLNFKLTGDRELSVVCILPQKISFEKDALNKTLGDAPFVLKVNGVKTEVTYSSSNTKVAGVDPKTGKVTVNGTGECEIKAVAAATEQYSEASAVCKLKVLPKPTATPAPTSKPVATVTVTPPSATKPVQKPTAKPSTKPTAGPTSKVTVAPTVKVTTPEPTSAVQDPKSRILDFVSRIYKYVLDREPEEEGANFWTDELFSFRRTGGEVGLGFIFSDEFTNRNLSDEDFVTVLYKTFFGRDPEPEGFAFWTGELKDGTLDHMAVAYGFVYSQEWADTCASYGIRSGGSIAPSVEIEPSDATYAFVERMYTTAMKRASDEEGAKFWANELSNFRFTGEQVGVMFFLSDEMKGFNLSNEEFVTRLYKTFMDREPEEGGFNFWVGYLNDGGTRESVVLGFTRSEEFVNKCIEARILPY